MPESLAGLFVVDQRRNGPYVAFANHQSYMLILDLGRQFLTQGFKESSALMCSKVDAVTKQDIHRVATRIFRPQSRTTPLNAGIGSGEPTIVGIGKNVEGLGDVRSVLKKWDLGAKL